MKITKIPLLEFIETLTDLYEAGVDYIDMNNSKNEGESNIIELTIEKEYMSKEILNKTKESIKMRFFDKDINDLI